jgi:hypothetical protein
VVLGSNFGWNIGHLATVFATFFSPSGQLLGYYLDKATITSSKIISNSSLIIL